MVGRFGGSSAGFVVAALNAASAASREVVVRRVLSAGILCPRRSASRDVRSKLRTTWAAAPTRCIVPAFGHGDQAFALSLFPGSLARSSNGLRFLAGLALGRLFIGLATPHLAKNALALHLLLWDPESLIDIVVTDEYPQMFSNRAAAALGGRDVVSHPSRSTDLDILGRLLTTITDNLIFDRLTLIERTKAGTFDSGNMDEHVSAAVLGLNESIALRRVEPFDSAGSHHGLLECALSGRTTIVRSLIRNQRCLGEHIQGCAKKQCQVRT
jgi:hypothetical protein